METALYDRTPALGVPRPSSGMGVPAARVHANGSLARHVSLRTELLVNLSLLATATLLLVITTLLLFNAVLESPSGILLLVVLVTADIALFLLFGYHLVGRLVLQPLAAVVSVADAVASGDRVRRVPVLETPEFARLANAINSMTDQLISEQERVVRAEKLASLGRLAAGVAHEVGNPLGAINGYAHLLKRRVRGDAESETMLADLEREAARVDRIMRALLDYARPRRATRGAVDPVAAVHGALALLEGQGVMQGVTLDARYDEPLPPLAGEAHALQQVLVNLLLNAADAVAGSGRIAVRVRLTTLAAAMGADAHRAGEGAAFTMSRAAARRVHAWGTAEAPGSLIEILVADSGPGIADEDRERIFDPFFTTKEPGHGTGLGLAIVARTVEDFGGIILVRPAREGGAAFVLLLPLHES